MRVLIVEDEMTIAFLIEDMLEDLGHQVVAVAMRLSEAVEVARQVEADLAILDINLDGHVSFPVADILAERAIPFAFATGYGALGLEGAYRERPVLAKPFLREHLAALIAKACGS
ncbi:response regulator [Sphingomonas azotifigens]|uniref:response regulator n=1 Tax=Sphingomonas azotifigens TaxID=330920 RepID=UPI0009FB9B62|nr:response regulator [Sphingomonas azotifigens]